MFPFVNVDKHLDPLTRFMDAGPGKLCENLMFSYFRAKLRSLSLMICPVTTCASAHMCTHTHTQNHMLMEVPLPFSSKETNRGLY